MRSTLIGAALALVAGVAAAPHPGGGERSAPQGFHQWEKRWYYDGKVYGWWGFCKIDQDKVDTLYEYQGCYDVYNIPNIRISDHPVQDTRPADKWWALIWPKDMCYKQCFSACRILGFRYSAIRGGKWCHCGNTINGDKTAESRCDSNCSADQKRPCGGHDAFSVWRDNTFDHEWDPAVEADNYENLGCYQDDWERVVRTTLRNSDNMSLQMCWGLCAEKGFAYCGVTEGRICFGGGALRPGALISKNRMNDCNWKCTGAPGQFCGGRWATHVFYNKNLDSYKPCDPNGPKRPGEKPTTITKKVGQSSTKSKKPSTTLTVTRVVVVDTEGNEQDEFIREPKITGTKDSKTVTVRKTIDVTSTTNIPAQTVTVTEVVVISTPGGKPLSTVTKKPSSTPSGAVVTTITTTSTKNPNGGKKTPVTITEIVVIKTPGGKPLSTKTITPDGPGGGPTTTITTTSTQTPGGKKTPVTITEIVVIKTPGGKPLSTKTITPDGPGGGPTTTITTTSTQTPGGKKTPVTITEVVVIKTPGGKPLSTKTVTPDGPGGGPTTTITTTSTQTPGGKGATPTPDPDAEEPEEPEEPEEKPDEENPDEEKPDEEKPDEENPDEEKPDEEKPDEENPDDEKPDEENPDEENPDDNEGNPGGKGATICVVPKVPGSVSKKWPDVKFPLGGIYAPPVGCHDDKTKFKDGNPFKLFVGPGTNWPKAACPTDYTSDPTDVQKACWNSCLEQRKDCEKSFKPKVAALKTTLCDAQLIACKAVNDRKINKGFDNAVKKNCKKYGDKIGGKPATQDPPPNDAYFRRRFRS
ncbi:hypothetical protein TWF281_009754 [Arthrobotrys megalospora]